MGWLSMNALLKSEEDLKYPEKAESGEAVPVQPPMEIHRPELLGAARIFSEWPKQIFRAILCVLLGIVLGLVCAVLLFTLLPILLDFEPEAEHLHMATSNLTSSRACALEAMARQHSQRLCHIIVLRSHPPETMNLLYNLRDSYPNLNAHYHPDPEDYFENSPLDGFFKFGRGNGGMLDLAARTLALWRHGGISVDLDHPVMQLPPVGQYIQQGNGALLQFPTPCHPALQGLIDQLERGDDNGDAKEVVNKATNWMCNTKSGKPCKPEHCLGVSVLGNNMNDAGNPLLCPVVQANTDGITSSTKAPDAEIKVNLLSSTTTSATVEKQKEQDDDKKKIRLLPK